MLRNETGDFTEEDVEGCIFPSDRPKLLGFKKFVTKDIARLENVIEEQKMKYLNGEPSDKKQLLSRQGALRIQKTLLELINIQLSLIKYRLQL